MGKIFRVNLGIYDIQTAWMIDNAINSSLACCAGADIDRKLNIVSYNHVWKRKFDFTEDRLVHSAFWFPHVGFSTNCEACIFFERCNNLDYDPYYILKQHIDYYITVLERVRTDALTGYGAKSYSKSSFNDCNLDSLNRCKFLLKFFSGTATEEEKEKYAGVPFNPFQQATLEAKINEYSNLVNVPPEIESKWYKILYNLRYDRYNPSDFEKYWEFKKA